MHHGLPKPGRPLIVQQPAPQLSEARVAAKQPGLCFVGPRLMLTNRECHQEGVSTHGEVDERMHTSLRGRRDWKHRGSVTSCNDLWVHPSGFILDAEGR